MNRRSFISLLAAPAAFAVAGPEPARAGACDNRVPIAPKDSSVACAKALAEAAVLSPLQIDHPEGQNLLRNHAGFWRSVFFKAALSGRCSIKAHRDRYSGQVCGLSNLCCTYHDIIEIPGTLLGGLAYWEQSYDLVSLCRIPPFILGLEDIDDQTARAQAEQFLKYTIRPWRRKIEASINRFTAQNTVSFDAIEFCTFLEPGWRS